MIAFREIDPDRDWDTLVELLTGSTWPHRVKPTLTEADVREEMSHGHYVPGRSLAFFVERDGDVVGLVAAHELDVGHEDPQLDFRVCESARGQGAGRASIAHITAEVFRRFPKVERIEGQTRRDNVAMRRTFVGGGYVQEAVYRTAWPGEGGPYDGIGYAILRSDWESGTTTPVDWDD